MTSAIHIGQLREAYIHATIESMDLETMTETLFRFMESDLMEVSSEDLIEEVRDYYPELIEDCTVG
jgi:hypothetical protein